MARTSTVLVAGDDERLVDDGDREPVAHIRDPFGAADAQPLLHEHCIRLKRQHIRQTYTALAGVSLLSRRRRSTHRDQPTSSHSACSCNRKTSSSNMNLRILPTLVRGNSSMIVISLGCFALPRRSLAPGTQFIDRGQSLSSSQRTTKCDRHLVANSDRGRRLPTPRARRGES